MVFTYSKVGLGIALNEEMINSFCLPYLVEVSSFTMLTLLLSCVQHVIHGTLASDVCESYVVHTNIHLQIAIKKKHLRNFIISDGMIAERFNIMFVHKIYHL